MTTHITTKISKNIRPIMKEWSLDFRGTGPFGSSPYQHLSNRLGAYATVTGSIRIERGFLMDLLTIAAGHISSDYASIPDAKTRNSLLTLQRESVDLAAWLSGLLGMDDVYTFNDDGEKVRVA